MAKKKSAKIRKDLPTVQPSVSIACHLARLLSIVHHRAHFILIPAVAWFGLMMFEMFMHIFIPESALRNRQLSIGARLFLLSYSLTISFLFIIVISCFLALLERIRNGTWIPRFTRGLMALLTCLILLVYC